MTESFKEKMERLKGLKNPVVTQIEQQKLKNADLDREMAEITTPKPKPEKIHKPKPEKIGLTEADIKALIIPLHDKIMELSHRMDASEPFTLNVDPTNLSISFNAIYTSNKNRYVKAKATGQLGHLEILKQTIDAVITYLQKQKK